MSGHSFWTQRRSNQDELPQPPGYALPSVPNSQDLEAVHNLILKNHLVRNSKEKQLGYRREPLARLYLGSEVLVLDLQMS